MRSQSRQRNVRFTYKLYNDDRFENIPGKSSLILLFRKILREINASLDLNLWIIYDGEWAIRLITLPTFDQQGKPGLTHVSWQKGIYSCPLKLMFDSNLCILCTAFLQKLYCARVSHSIVLKMADLSILMEPTLLLEKGSATVSYNAFGWCWYLNVASMLAA